MSDLVSNIGQAMLVALGMAWKTGWTLVLGFTISAVLQALVPADRIKEKLGHLNHGRKMDVRTLIDLCGSVV